jgi:outer membrane murein-binding lipoprotein Lpp
MRGKTTRQLTTDCETLSAEDGRWKQKAEIWKAEIGKAMDENQKAKSRNNFSVSTFKFEGGIGLN